MVQFNTLEDFPMEDLLDVFNGCFADYILPFKLSLPQLEGKILGEDISLHLSVGSVVDGKIVGFVLHGCRVEDGKKVSYNAGTGVLPNWRGHGLTKKMYDYILPNLGIFGICKISLEVITENEAAKHIYRKLGFKVQRILNCYKRNNGIETKAGVEPIHELAYFDGAAFELFKDWKSAWQNSNATIMRNFSKLKIIGISKNEKTVAYAAFNTYNKRLLQLAVDPNFRNQGIGQTLIGFLVKNYGHDISIINVDAQDPGFNIFLNKMGFEVYLQQEEMVMELK